MELKKYIIGCENSKDLKGYEVLNLQISPMCAVKLRFFNVKGTDFIYREF